MQLCVLSYNLKSGAAYHEVEELAEQYKPDIICLQEARPSATEEKIGHLALAAKTEEGRYGLAIYYDVGRLAMTYGASHKIGLSAYERIFDPTRDRLLITHLQEQETGQDITIGCFHATQFFAASNNLRRQQVQTAITQLETFAHGTPAILVGDYNYPFLIRGLHTFMRRHGFQLAISDQPTFQGRLMNYYLDFAAAKHVQSLSIDALPFGTSDHRPILATTII